MQRPGKKLKLCIFEFKLLFEKVESNQKLTNQPCVASLLRLPQPFQIYQTPVKPQPMVSDTEPAFSPVQPYIVIPRQPMVSDKEPRLKSRPAIYIVIPPQPMVSDIEPRL